MIKEWIAAAVALAVLAGAFLLASQHGLIPKVDPGRTLSSTNATDGFGYFSGHSMRGNNHPAMYAGFQGGSEVIVVLGADSRETFPMSRFDEATAAYRKLMQGRGFHPFTPAPMPMSRHPILGSWNLEIADTSCTEREVWEASGQAHNRSAREESTSHFEIAAQPDEKGFYPVVDTIVESNGEPDCYGHKTPIGDQAINFIRFADDGQSFSICQTEDASACFMKARRVQASP